MDTPPTLRPGEAVSHCGVCIRAWMEAEGREPPAYPLSTCTAGCIVVNLPGFVWPLPTMPDESPLEHVTKVVGRVIAPGDDVAVTEMQAGGWCAPPSPLYDFPMVSVPRGGITYPRGEPGKPWRPPTRRQRACRWTADLRARFRRAARAWRDEDDDQ